ncbi:MAG: class I SAM-dependent methyltransferase [Pyrinomonadaceae bacterium]
MNLDIEFEKRKPWITRFEINKISYGGSFDALNDARLTQFFECFPQAETILELGSLEGGHSFGLAKNPRVKTVTAIEARAANLKKARFIKDVIGDEKVKFVEADLQKTNLADFGKFDAIFCSGLLYHLPKPWELLNQFNKISSNVFIWTQYAGEEEAEKIVEGYRGKWYQESGWSDPLSGVSEKSFWLSLGSLVEILTDNEFKNLKIIDKNPHHPHGRAITFAASTSKID